MINEPVLTMSSASRMVTVHAPSAYGTRELVARYGCDQTGRRRPVMIVRTRAVTNTATARFRQAA